MKRNHSFGLSARFLDAPKLHAGDHLAAACMGKPRKFV
jgi:hypothetical protein